jgi:hypothetical protein
MPVLGVQRVLRTIDKAKADKAINIAIGIDQCLDIILKKADYFCPVDKGTMKASGRKTVTGRGFGVRGTVEYGGTPETSYTIHVHENLDAKHAPPTRAKWLVAAVNATRGTCTSLLGRQFLVENPQEKTK